VLVGGFVRGTWRAERTHSKATLVIELFEPLSREDRDALAEEGERLACIAWEDAGTFEVRIIERA
jgi:hypothetical protein